MEEEEEEGGVAAKSFNIHRDIDHVIERDVTAARSRRKEKKKQIPPHLAGDVATPGRRVKRRQFHTSTAGGGATCMAAT